jgi:hypothetical protein
MGKIKVTYTIEEFIEINVADYGKSTQDLEMFADDKASEVVPDNADDWEWEWIKRPKTKFEQLQPPHYGWFDKGSQSLKAIGLAVVGVENPAYLIKDGGLVAILMATNNKGADPDRFFQFNEGDEE